MVTSKPINSKRILIVDDIAVNRQVAQAILESGGHEVSLASTSFEAMQQIEQGGIGLVLLDISAVHKDGLELSAHIRALGAEHRSIAILGAMTALPPDQIAAAKAAGIDDFIDKPFKPHALLATVESWMSNPQLAGMAANVFEKHILNDLMEVLGYPLFEKLVNKFRGDLERDFLHLQSDTNSEDLARNAHIFISASGMLGFTSFSQLCREAEEQCKTGADLTGIIEHLRRETQWVLQEIRSWR